MVDRASCECQREGDASRPDGVDVGRCGKSAGGRKGSHGQRSRRPCRFETWCHAVSVRCPARQHRFGTNTISRRNRCKRTRARRPEPAADCSSRRPLGTGSASLEQRCGSQRDGPDRFYGPASRRSGRKAGNHKGAPRKWRESGYQTGEGPAECWTEQPGGLSTCQRCWRNTAVPGGRSRLCRCRAIAGDERRRSEHRNKRGHDTTDRRCRCGSVPGSCGRTGTGGVGEKHFQTIKVLGELGVDVKSVGENGLTALHCTAYMGPDSAKQLSVEKGAKEEIL